MFMPFIVGVAATVDWLVETVPQAAGCALQDELLVCDNGLLRRSFALKPAFGTVAFELNMPAAKGGPRSLLRAVRPEALLTLDDTEYAIGGLVQNTTFLAFLNRSSLQLVRDSSRPLLGYRSYEVRTALEVPFPWKPGTRHAPAELSWPPKGVELRVVFSCSSGPHAGVSVTVHYALYDGIPLMSKWLTVQCPSCVDKVVVRAATVEVLSVNVPFGAYLTHGSMPPGADWGGAAEACASSSGKPSGPLPWLQAKTDQAHSASCLWQDDWPLSRNPRMPQLKDQGAVEPRLNCSYTHAGPGVHIGGVEDFTSFRALLLAGDSHDVGRQSLMRHRVTQLLAPHTTENPMFFHATNVSDAGFKVAVDQVLVCLPPIGQPLANQAIPVAPRAASSAPRHRAHRITRACACGPGQMADVGFEMIIFSFGSGFNLETADARYLATIKRQVSAYTRARISAHALIMDAPRASCLQVDYARSKGVEVGGYDLICLDRGHGGYGGNVGDEWVAVGVDGSLKADACFASGWYDKLHGLVTNFIRQTGISMLETDGPYGGGECACTNHSHHHGLDDSIYQQNRLQASFYTEMRALNVFVNQPDNYFFTGGMKTGMGYDENQYSLPRWQDLLISRAGMYDDLYAHTPTQGWMFVPIGVYHAGGSAASFEPLDAPDNLGAYNLALAQYLGAGVAACYRGDVLYQGEPSRAVVRRWAGFYKRHRSTLTQPIVHLRRADGQGWDGWLHVNPFKLGQNNGNGDEVGLAVLFNPTDRPMDAVDVALPLYYTGLTDKARVQAEGELQPTVVALARDYTVMVRAAIPARGATYFVILSA